MTHATHVHNYWSYLSCQKDEYELIMKMTVATYYVLTSDRRTDVLSKCAQYAEHSRFFYIWYTCVTCGKLTPAFVRSTRYIFMYTNVIYKQHHKYLSKIIPNQSNRSCPPANLKYTKKIILPSNQPRLASPAIW